MIAEAFIKQYRKNIKLIENKKKDRLLFMELATGTAVRMDGERVQTSSKGSLEKKVIEVVQIDEEIEQLRAENYRIIKTIEKLNEIDYDILHKMYIQGVSNDSVKKEYGKGASWVTWAKRRALDNLQMLLDSE